MSSKTAADFVPTDSITGYSVILLPLTQSSTSAPTGSTRRNDTAATLTLARTSAGLYTITASSAVFTVGKTDVIIPALANSLHRIKVVNTSTTVLTLTTSVESYSLGIVTTATDGILDGKTFEIRIYD